MLDFSNRRMWSMLGQRGVFALRMSELADQYKKLVVLTADLGQLSGLDRFKREYPERLINAGIAEQNMIGMAAGLAHEGFIPFVTTYATFVSMRSCEQIRHLCAYAKNPVKIIASGSGFAMGMSGNSHYTYEDLAIMRAIPGMTVLSPADCAETVKMLDAIIEYPFPVYMRLGGNMNCPIIYKEDYTLSIGKVVHLDEYEGRQSVIFATGTMVAESIKAAKMLRESGIDVHVVNIHTIKPIDVESILAACQKTRLIVSVEEHSAVGGLGGAIAEVMSGVAGTPKLLRIGMPNEFVHPAEYSFLLTKYGLTAAGISEKIIHEL